MTTNKIQGHTFVPDKSFGSLSEISQKNHIFLKHLIHNFNQLKFTDQNSQSLQIEDKINLTLVIKQYSH